MRGRCPPGGVIGPPVDNDINHIVLSSLKSMFSDQGEYMGRVSRRSNTKP